MPSAEAGRGREARAGSAVPSVSVVLPVLDGADTLPFCLAALRASTFRDFEIVAVDDGSTDATARLLAEAGVDVLLRNQAPAGCFAARNQGAAAARGGILVFVDSDVEVAPDTLAKVRRRFDDAGTDAVIGLYALEHPHANAASRYKNAWIRWSYLNHGDHDDHRDEVDWFFTAIGAVRRDAWAKAGGFAEQFRRDTGGGDLDFGRRLRDVGFVVHLDKSLAVVHRRRFTLRSLLVNDFRRAFGWAALGLSRRGIAGSARHGLANVSAGFVASIALAGGLLAFAALALWQPALGPLPVVTAAAYVALARGFPLWVAQHVSIPFALQCAALQFADHVACGLGVLAALVTQGAAFRPPPSEQPRGDR